MQEKLTLPRKRPADKSMDFQFLRDQGLKHIEKLGSKIWTDYNVHDPGITILEVLCYAITDLGYRTSFEMEDLLAEPEGSTSPPQFFTAKEVLTCNPVTETDLRKVLIDIPRVKNAWIYIAESSSPTIYVDRENSSLVYHGTDEDILPLKGLYRILLELDDHIDQTDTGLVDSIRRAVAKKLSGVRNLCEDYLSIEVTGIEKIGICADIEVTGDTDIEESLSEIYFRIHQFISPAVHFYSLEEMLDKGRKSEEIFEGPFTDHGFIDSEELKATVPLGELHVSDLYKEVMKVAGVQSIRKFYVLSYDQSDNLVSSEEWCVLLHPPSLKARLDIECSSVTFYRGIVPFHADDTKVREKFNRKLGTVKRPHIKGDANDFKIPKGTYHDIADYTSIQEEFPLVYGIGSEGLPDSAVDLRKAQAKQLKGYLTFFDQILADYLAQLSKVKDLFSVHNTDDRTYFENVLYDVPHIWELLVDYSGSDPNLNQTEWVSFQSDVDNGYRTKLRAFLEEETTRWDRRNRFLDHLMARFGERFNDYALLMYDMYRNTINENLIADKENFLRDYPVISRDRGKAFDYNARDKEENQPDVWDTLNVSGLEARIARLLGIEDYRRRHLFCESVYSIEIARVTEGEDEVKYGYGLKDPEHNLLLTSIELYDTSESAEENAGLLEIQLLNEDNYEVAEVGASQYRVFIRGDDSNHIAGSEDLFDSNIEAIFLKDRILELVYPEEGCGEEGLHLVEHILLRPLSTDFSLLPVSMNGTGCPEKADPYSFRITVVLPSWPKRFQEWTFRKFFEDTVRQETPAHIAVKICWVSCRQMRIFEEAYRDWLEERAKAIPDKEALGDSANVLINELFSLKNVQQQARLHDCKTTKDALVLGHSKLGIGNK